MENKICKWINSIQFVNKKWNSLEQAFIIVEPKHRAFQKKNQLTRKIWKNITIGVHKTLYVPLRQSNIKEHTQIIRNPWVSSHYKVEEGQQENILEQFIYDYFINIK